jgi:hypothetical protein
MPEEFKNIGAEYQRLGKEGFDAATRSIGEMNKGFQALAAEMTDYSKRTFEDVFHAWEQLLGAKSVGQIAEIQSQFAAKAYETYLSELSKLGVFWLRPTSSYGATLTGPPNWPAPGFKDTELGVWMEQEVGHGEAEVHTRVQA